MARGIQERNMVNSSLSNEIAINSAGLLYSHPGNRRWAVGFAYERHWNKREPGIYEYSTKEGNPHFLSLGAAVDVLKPLTAGIALRILDGKKSNETLYSGSYETNYEGSSLQVGLTVDLNRTERQLPLVLGLSYRPSYDFESSYPSGKQVDTQPTEYSLGLLFTPFSDLDISFDVDVVDPNNIERTQTYSSGSKLTTDPYAYSNLMLGGRIGLEYRKEWSNGALKLRGGLLSLPLYSGKVDDPMSEMYFVRVLEPGRAVGYSIGAGFDLSIMRFDVAWASYRYRIWANLTGEEFSSPYRYDQEYRFNTLELQWTVFLGK